MAPLLLLSMLMQRAICIASLSILCAASAAAEPSHAPLAPQRSSGWWQRLGATVTTGMLAHKTRANQMQARRVLAEWLRPSSQRPLTWKLLVDLHGVHGADHDVVLATREGRSLVLTPERLEVRDEHQRNPADVIALAAFELCSVEDVSALVASRLRALVPGAQHAADLRQLEALAERHVQDLRNEVSAVLHDDNVQLLIRYHEEVTRRVDPSTSPEAELGQPGDDVLVVSGAGEATRHLRVHTGGPSQPVTLDDLKQNGYVDPARRQRMFAEQLLQVAGYPARDPLDPSTLARARAKLIDRIRVEHELDAMLSDLPTAMKLPTFSGRRFFHRMTVAEHEHRYLVLKPDYDDLVPLDAMRLHVFYLDKDRRMHSHRATRPDLTRFGLTDPAGLRQAIQAALDNPRLPAP